MLKYLAKRIGRSILTLFIIVTLVFCLLRLMPVEGYFANYEKMTEAQIQAGLQSMGLLDPLPVQIGRFWVNMLHGDLGVSHIYKVNASVTGILAKKLPISIQMGVYAMLLSLVIGIPMGLFMGRFKSRWPDKIGTAIIVLIQAVPAAVYYLYIQMYGTTALNVGLLFDASNWKYWVLPVCSMSLGNVAFYAMWLRRYMVDESNKDYVRLARAKGVSENNIALRHIYKVNASVTGILAKKLPISIQMGVYAMLLSLVIGIPMGLFMGRFKSRWPDKIGTAIIVLIQAVPAAVYYLYIQMYGTTALNVGLLFDASNWKYWVLPVCSMSLGNVAFYAMWLRRYMVDESNKDYVRLARAKGVSENNIALRHIFRNAMVPLVQYIPSAFLNTVVGSIYIESLYSIPGMGGLLVTCVQRHDNTMVQGIVLLYACVGIIGLILGDLLMVLIDPRISFGKKEGGR